LAYNKEKDATIGALGPDIGMQDLPTPEKVPISKIRDYLTKVRDSIIGYRPLAGKGIKISEFPGQGTQISIEGDTGGGTITVTTGDTSEGSPVVVTDLPGVTTITFDQDLFILSKNDLSGEAYIDLNTENCGDIDGGDST